MNAESLMRIAANAWGMWVELAPWLCLGLVTAGLLKSVIPNSLVKKWLGGKGIWSVLKAAIIGTPLPLCSCSVLPAAIQLHRSGASPGATVSFLIATPENGADSLSMSWGILGPGMTLVRLCGATLSSVIAGVLASVWGDQRGADSVDTRIDQLHPPASDPPPAQVAIGLSTGLLRVIDTNSAGAAAPPNIAGLSDGDLIEAGCANSSGATTDCCSSQPEVRPNSRLQLVVQGVGYAFTRLLSDISGWLVLGVVIAAIMQQWIPANAAGRWGGGPLTMLAMLAVSVPTYVCATASTPIAASLLAAGLSPGAVLVFLLAGPATNFSSAGIVRRELGNRAVAAYLTGVVGITFLVGLCVDWLLPGLGQQTRQHLHDHASAVPNAVAVPLAILLAARMIWLRLATLLAGK